MQVGFLESLQLGERGFLRGRLPRRLFGCLLLRRAGFRSVFTASSLDGVSGGLALLRIRGKALQLLLQQRLVLSILLLELLELLLLKLQQNGVILAILMELLLLLWLTRLLLHGNSIETVFLLQLQLLLLMLLQKLRLVKNILLLQLLQPLLNGFASLCLSLQCCSWESRLLDLLRSASRRCSLRVLVERR